MKSSTNAYINTVRQITQQESKQVLKSIAKIFGILMELRIKEMAEKEKDIAVKSSTNRLQEYCLPTLKKVSEC